MKKILSALSALCLLATSGLATANPPSTSRYFTDSQVMYNNDSTTEAFDLVSTVACFLNKVKPEFNSDGTAYVAWVEYGICDSGMGNQSSSTKPFEKAAIKATYNSASGILNVKMWLTGWEGDDSSGATVYEPAYIWINVDVLAGPSLEPPLGRWSMQFCMQTAAQVGAGIPQPASGTADAASCGQGFGYATVNPTEISVYMQGFQNGAKAYEVAGTATYTVSGGRVTKGEGQFRAFTTWQGANTTDYAFAFDGDIYKLRTINGGTSTDVCTNRNIDAVAPLINNWNGWLYNVTTGDAVDLTGGFNVKLATGSVSDWSRTGWVGYWGLWFPDKDSAGNVISISSGQSVYGNGKDSMDVEYIYKRSKGSLQQQSISNGGFDSVKNTRFTAHINAQLLNNRAADEWSSYQMFWNGTAFTVEGKQSSDGQSLDSGSGNTGTVTLQQMANRWMSDLWGWIPGTSIGLRFTVGTWQFTGGNRVLVAADPATAQVTRTVRTDIYPGTPESGLVDLADGTELLCFGGPNHCPTMGAGGIEASPARGWSGSVTAVRYRWDGVNGNLTHESGGATRVVESSSYRNIGPLFKSDANLSNYACNQTEPGGTRLGFFRPDNPDGSTNSSTFVVGGTCADRAWSVAGTTYEWTTNTSSPNWPSRGFLVRADNGKRPVFDKPISTTYTPASGAFSGKTQYMSYNGGGQFWVPSTCYSRSTRQEVSCGGNDIFWSSNFDIPFVTTDAGKVTDQQDTTKKYLVKFLGRSFLYGISNDPLCTTLAVPSGMTLPLESGWKDPHASGSANYLGTWQKPDAAPKYINGVAQ